MKSLSIFGCGWIGLALLPALLPTYKVKASVPRLDAFEKLPLKEKFLLNADNDYFSADFYQSDTIIIAIPPKGSYLETIQTLLKYINKTAQIILLSSTSVYDQTEGIVDENSDKEVKNVSLMLQTERYLQENHQNVLILRLGGLMGYDRIAGKYTAGKSLENDAFVNYIHRDDVVAVIKMFIDKNISSDVVNIVAPIHASKKEIYDKNALAFGFEKTHFSHRELKGKKVSSKKLRERYHYKFLKNNPLNFW